MALKLVFASLSKQGRGAVNEDAIGHVMNESGTGCWVVADGKCHRGGGELAAKKVVDTILTTFLANPDISTEFLQQSFQLAQREMLELQADSARNKSMCASVAVICANRRNAVWAHIGDVRIYAFRNGELIAQTKDHSFAQSLVKSGDISAEALRQHDDRYRLTRSLGMMGEMQPEILMDRFILYPGDLLLICSDGFWEHVTELEMQLDWCKSSSLVKWLEHMEVRLLKTAPKEHDHYSAIALLAETE
jgi:serine/threonine protein phosphatase PrpC